MWLFMNGICLGIMSIQYLVWHCLSSRSQHRQRYRHNLPGVGCRHRSNASNRFALVLMMLSAEIGKSIALVT